MTLGAIAILGMPILTGQLRIAGLVATAGAIWLTYGTASSPLKTGLLAIANGHLLIFVVQFCCPGLRHFGEMTAEQLRLTAFPLAWAMALSAWGWERRKLSTEASPNIPSTAFQALSLFCVAAVLHRNAIPLTLSQLVTLILMFVTLILLHGWMAIKKTPPTIDEDKPHAMEGATFHVWVSILLAAACLGSLWWFGVIAISGTVGLFTPIVLAFAAAAVSYFSKRSTSLAAFVEPFERVAITLPALTVFAGLSRQFNVASPNWLGINSLAMLMASGFYFWRGLETRTAGPLFGSLGIFNLLLVMIWQELQWSDPQLFMIPMGFSVLLMVETLRDKIPTSLHNPLRYAGALTILVSPTFHIVGGSWLHLVTLMVVSVVIVLVAMGLRVKALMYTGTAFLIADMIAIVVRGSFDNPNLLWLVGIAIGAAVIGLAAYCERHREQMLQRLRLLSAQLETWS